MFRHPELDPIWLEMHLDKFEGLQVTQVILVCGEQTQQEGRKEKKPLLFL